MRQPSLLSCLFLLLSAAPLLAVAQTTEPVTVSVPGQTVVPAGNRHTLNLKDADIGVLIQTVSEITGKSFIVDPSVQGRVTVISSSPISNDAIYQVFESVLRVHGFAAIPAGSMIKIVPVATALSDGGVGSAASGGPDGLVTRVIQVQHQSARELAEWLRPLIPAQGQLLANADSNSLLITDRAANVERLQRIIERIDRSSDGEVEVIALQHANAAEVARTLTALEQGGQPAAINRPDSARLVADARTNSILLSGGRSERLRLRTLIAHLDTPLGGSENTQVVFLNNASAEDLMPILEGVAKALTGETAEGARSATIQAHAETNALVITAAPAVIRGLESVARQLDVRRAQVMVEAVIVEVTDDLASEIGVQWQASDIRADDSADGFTPGIIGGTNFPNNSGTGGIVDSVTNPLGAFANSNGLNLGYLGGAVTIPGVNGGDPIFQVGALVRALRGDTRANVLSQPSLVTLDNHKAEFKVVQEVPFLTGQYTNTSSSGGSNQPTNPFQTIDRKDVGLILTVTPHINEGSAVRLDLKQELSSLAPTVTGAVDLITNKRELSTSVLVPDGGMLILGGLTSDEARRSASGVPGLSKIPLLGGLFRSKGDSRSQRQLMIFLRPRILRDAATEAALSSDKYNFLRAEQLRRENEPRKYAPGPVLPELDQISPDLFRNPPPLESDDSQ